MEEKLMVSAEKFIRGMRCKTLDIDSIRFNGAPLSEREKSAILQVAKWTIDNDDLPDGKKLEISNCGRKIKCSKPFELHNQLNYKRSKHESVKK